MDCLHCGVQLDKSDILCLRCGTPVLTEDDISLMPNAVTTRSINEAHSSTGSRDDDFSLRGSDTQHIDPAEPVATDQPTVTAQPTTGVHDEDTPNKAQPSGSNLKAVLITIAAALTVIAGIFLFMILRPTEAKRNDADPSLSTPGTEDPTGAGITTSPSSIEIIYVYRDGQVQFDFHTMVGETVLLRATIEPEGVEGNIIWTSSDPLVLDVAQVDERGLEARITGIAAGVEDLHLKVGGYEISYTVFIDNQPMHLQLENAIDSNNTPIWLTVTLYDGSNGGDGDVIRLERDIDRNIWLMEVSNDQFEVDPLFSRDGSALTMGFQGQAGLFGAEVFYFFANGSGHMSSPQSGSEVHLSWGFITSMIEPEG